MPWCRILNQFSKHLLANLLLLVCLTSFSVAFLAQSKSVELDPRVTALYAEAKTAQASGDRAGAIAKYESILKIAPRLGAAYNNLGALYFAQGDYPNAVAILEKGLKIDPKMSSAVALLGVALYKTDDY